MICLGTPSDLEAVRQCVADAYELYVARIGKKPAPMLDDYSKLIAQQRVWLAKTDNTLAGLIVLWPRHDHLYVDNIAVSPPLQGKGVGSALLDHADALARQQDLTEIRLHTNEAMSENITYYPRRGFSETHRSHHDGYHRVYYSRAVPKF